MCQSHTHICPECNNEYECTLPDYACPVLNDDEIQLCFLCCAILAEEIESAEDN